MHFYMIIINESNYGGSKLEFKELFRVYQDKEIQVYKYYRGFLIIAKNLNMNFLIIWQAFSGRGIII